MERAIQIYAIVNLTVIGISHVVRPRVWVDFFVFLRKRGEAGVFAVALLNLRSQAAVCRRFNGYACFKHHVHPNAAFANFGRIART